MDPDTGSRRHRRLTSGQDTWSARCGVIRTPGAAGGPGKPTGSNPGRAPRSDPTNEGWTHLAAHQACCSHLLRDFTDAAQAHPDAVWPEQAQRALRGLIHAFNQARDAGQPEIAPLVRDPLISSFRHAVRVGLAQVRANPGPRSSTKQPPGRVLLEFCRDRETDVLLFVTDTRIWPTNNISERGLRPTKTQQKISGRLTSEIITQDRLDIRSYIDTMRKHGVDVLTGIRDALTGNPWRPPLSAPT